jgi:hypothetical protein
MESKTVCLNRHEFQISLAQTNTGGWTIEILHIDRSGPEPSESRAAIDIEFESEAQALRYANVFAAEMAKRSERPAPGAPLAPDRSEERRRSPGQRGSGWCRLTVAAPSGQLRVVPVWQALQQCGARATGMLARHDGKRNVDELVLAVGPDTSSVREAILTHLQSQTWITNISIDDNQDTFHI